jgi:hypothetical protein
MSPSTIAPRAIATVRAVTRPRITAVYPISSRSLSASPRLNIAVPNAGDCQVETAFDLTVAMHFARDDELTRPAEVADEYRFGADDRRRGGVEVEEPAPGIVHDRPFNLTGPGADVTRSASPTDSRIPSRIKPGAAPAKGLPR